MRIRPWSNLQLSTPERELLRCALLLAIVLIAISAVMFGVGISADPVVLAISLAVAVAATSSPFIALGIIQVGRWRDNR